MKFGPHEAGFIAQNSTCRRKSNTLIRWLQKGADARNEVKLLLPGAFDARFKIPIYRSLQLGYVSISL